jgi:hypothetical protein
VKRRDFIAAIVGAVGAAVLPAIPVAAALPGREHFLKDNLNRNFSACHYCDAKTWEQHKIGCPRESALCRNCGSETDIDLVDTHLPYGPERDRTVCFSCEPRARVILRYSSSPWAHMAARQHNIRCSRCHVGSGVIHVEGRPFEYRLCYACAPEARECRRWVKDLRGWPRNESISSATVPKLDS